MSCDARSKRQFIIRPRSTIRGSNQVGNTCSELESGEAT